MGFSEPLKPVKRIFWLGMHNVLVQTELPRLRSLGYEVFNPPYLSSVVDQSAVIDWSDSFPCTLPKEVREVLAKVNFFYDKIPNEAAELLNTYFDLVIVTINPSWLHNLLSVYHGAVIYRVYGQPYSLSQELLNNETFELISEREDFWFCPHSDKVLNIEDNWLQERMRIIPYCITDDVVSIENTWQYSTDRQDMGLLCPRILDIPYYATSYAQLSHSFPKQSYKIFGKQVIEVNDPRVMGNLERNDLLLSLQRLRGFVYHYCESTVCYLPPIEFMIIGGPVIALEGSLLARYHNVENSPGIAKDMEALVRLANQVQHNGCNLAEEIIDSQRQVASLYHPKTVWPIFDATMRGLIDDEVQIPASHFVYSKLVSHHSSVIENDDRLGPLKGETVLVPFHHFGPAIIRHGYDYHCAEGIARVARMVARVLCDNGYRVVVTSRREDAGRILGFFRGQDMPKMNVQVMIVDEKKSKIRPLLKSLLKRMLVKCGETGEMSHSLSGTAVKKMRLLALVSAKLAMISHRILNKLNRHVVMRFTSLFWIKAIIFPGYISAVNRDSRIKKVIVPHYYLFPEVLRVRKPVLLYLPDYLPHFYPKNVEMGSVWSYALIGKLLSNKARIVFTNSRYTQRYLPNTILKTDPDKIVSFPLPSLNKAGADEGPNSNEVGLDQLPSLFVFYPTRNRPTKRLMDFVRTVMIVNERFIQLGRKERLYGVLTTEYSVGLDNDMPNGNEYLKCFADLSDADLARVYKNAVALLFTSENEGNFPTQVNEALHLGVPVVATNIPLIYEELGDLGKELPLIKVGDCERMAEAVLEIIEDREAAVEKQSNVQKYVVEKFSHDAFNDNIINMLNLIDNKFK